MLESLGYRVLMALDGPEALRVYGARQGQIDLVLTDAKLLEMSGLDLLDGLMQINPSVKVIMMSGQNLQWIKDRRIVTLEAVLQKPIVWSQLKEAVRKALAE